MDVGGRRNPGPRNYSVQPCPITARAHVDPSLQGTKRPIRQAGWLVMGLCGVVFSSDVTGSGKNSHGSDPLQSAPRKGRHNHFGIFYV